MRWKLKAAVQNALALLPEQLGNRAYYLLQKRLGGLRRFTPLRPLHNGLKTAARIRAAGRTAQQGVFLDVGTGWDLFLPISYWLMGARRVITVDVNRHLQPDLLGAGLRYMGGRRAEIESLFGPHLVQERLDALLGADPDNTPAVIALCNITYLAPADAASTGLADKSVDFHTSCTVLEHITPEDLRSIFIEARRVLRDDGLLVHAVDYTDHFSHSDRSISEINFLRYSPEEWRRYAGTRFMYCNRLRHDELVSLLRSVGCRIVAEEPDVKPALAQQLAQGLSVHPQFLGKDLAVTGAWLVCRPG